MPQNRREAGELGKPQREYLSAETNEGEETMPHRDNKNMKPNRPTKKFSPNDFLGGWGGWGGGKSGGGGGVGGEGLGEGAMILVSGLGGGARFGRKNCT